jgi:hypothetical protein
MYKTPLEWASVSFTPARQTGFNTSTGSIQSIKIKTSNTIMFKIFIMVHLHVQFTISEIALKPLLNVSLFDTIAMPRVIGLGDQGSSSSLRSD